MQPAGDQRPPILSGRSSRGWEEIAIGLSTDAPPYRDYIAPASRAAP